jgi:hypothetical protein
LSPGVTSPTRRTILAHGQIMHTITFPILEKMNGRFVTEFPIELEYYIAR